MISMTKLIHVIVVGDQADNLHLAGIPKFRADEVLLFSSKNDTKLQHISSSISRMGIEPRIIFTEDQYFDCYRKANIEAGASFVDDVIVAINMTTGSRVMVTAVEDAFKTQLVYFHIRNKSYSGAAAFRYYLSEGSTRKIQIVPVWNSYSKYHNDMFEILAETKEFITVAKMHELLYDRGSEVGGYESFRKEFRRFRKWFKNVPCFKENMKKGPEYRIDFH